MDIIKLGGSVITIPESTDCFNQNVVDGIARVFAQYGGQAILVHGTGHIGKPPALRYGYVESGLLERERRSIGLQIKSSIRMLNHNIAQQFLHHSVDAIPLGLELAFDRGMEEFLSPEVPHLLRQYLQCGMTPLLYGDFMPLENGAFQVFSSDIIVKILARELKPDRVIFLSNVEGVYADAKQTELIHEIREQDLRTLNLFQSDRNDVSGGMTEKIRHALEIARYGCTCYITGGHAPDNFARLLQGDENIGTRILI